MFFLGKVLGLLTQPLVWVSVLLLVSLLVLRTRPRLGRSVITLALALLLVMGWQPLPDLGLRALEDRYTEIPPDGNLSAFSGVVVLGGAMGTGYVAQDHQQPVMNDSAERMTAAAAIALR